MFFAVHDPPGEAMPKEDTVSESTPDRIEFDFDRAKIYAVRFLLETISTEKYGKSRLSHKAMAESLGIAAKEKFTENAGRKSSLLSDFLNCRQLNDHPNGRPLSDDERLRYLKVTRIYDRIGEEVKKQLASLPPYVKAVYNFAYLSDPEGEQLHKRGTRLALRELEDYFLRCNTDSHNGIAGKALSQLGGKIYDIYRWAAPSNEYRDGPRAIRAALRFISPLAEGSFLRFELLYKPYAKDDTRHTETGVWKSTGLVLPIAEHVYFLAMKKAPTTH